MQELNELLKITVSQKASDLHLRADMPAVLRINGKLNPIKDKVFTIEQMEKIAQSIMNDKQREVFMEKGECDLSYAAADIGRFRGNVYRQKGTVNIVMRCVPSEVPSLDSIGLPDSIKRIAENHRGLVLVTGTTGCGKSTTLAAMIDYINSSRSTNIITIEDPIEFLHKDKLSIISQRELGLDTLSYSEALKHVVRQDPDVILIGEMRDNETMAAALTAAQTGHLVLSTIHTIDAVQTVTRIIDMFPPHHQNQIRLQLADTLKGVISQRLLPSTKRGRVPACEILVVTTLVKKHIEQNTMGEITQAIKQGNYYGMQLFNQALLNLYNSGDVALEDVLAAASNPEELMMNVRGITSGSESTGIG
ncbi:MAG: PilT/PilU family type 4a pilus ATPase [Elusimicrobia bacterium]|nr:PilT/PilU family type 4a pilus ATPase [Elusimicrobiota bacterium]